MFAQIRRSAWPCNTLGNHDAPRVWSRYGDGVNSVAQARLHLALLLTLKGTPFLYNGEELGMADLELTALDQIRDAAAIRQYKLLIERRGASAEEALREVFRTTRDRCRSPMQWSAEPNAGFCPAKAVPWLPVNPNHRTGVNVADQADDPGSLLSFYKRMLALRRAMPALVVGDYHALHLESEAYFAFLRHDGENGQQCLVLLNFSARAQPASLDLGGKACTLRFSTAARTVGATIGTELTLAPFEVCIAEMV